MYDHKHRIESKHEINDGKCLARAIFTDEELEEMKKRMLEDDRSIDEKIDSLDDDFSKFE